MARRSERFPEEERTHGALSPGIVTDDEYLERRLPPGAQETRNGAIPQSVFPRRDLQWTKGDGGASVDRCRFAPHGVTGRRGVRGTIRAKVEDIRGQTDRQGDRLWSITDRPVPSNRAHAEIQREPRGKMPGRSERNQLLEAWRGATALLIELQADDPEGRPELQLIPDAGVEIHWRSGRNSDLRRVLQVESVAEAVRAYVGAGIIAATEAAATQHELEDTLAESSPTEGHPCKSHTLR